MNTQPEQQPRDTTLPVDGTVAQPAAVEKSGKKNPLVFIIPGVLILALVGFFVFRATRPTQPPKPVVQEEETIEETLEEVDSAIQVTLVKSKAKDNSVVIGVAGLGGKYTSIGYELQYESGGVGKGVTSGSKPLDVTGQQSFEREIYLGTCSKNVCKPDVGVTSVDLVLEFTNTEGKKSQFSKSFQL